MRDADSFDEFYRSTSARLMRYGYAVVGDLAEAQDVVQEAYTRAWQRWRTVAGHPHPEAWVRLVVTRLATDRWRRLARWHSVLHRAGPPEHAHPPNEDTMVVVAALRRLPVAQRQALALHYLFDLPVAEIARETGVAVGTVTSWLSRGRAGLADVLAGTAPPGRARTSRAEKGRAETTRAGTSRAEKGPVGTSRAEKGRAERSRAETSQATPAKVPPVAETRPAGTRPAASGVWEGNDDE
jgi:RNA polymerase sigma-70 factor (ECF subfamily)